MSSNVKLKKVFIVPNFGSQLVAVSEMDSRYLEISFKDRRCTIKSIRKIFARGALRNYLYVIDILSLRQGQEIAFLADLHLWRERLAHVDTQGMFRMVRNSGQRSKHIYKTGLSRRMQWVYLWKMTSNFNSKVQNITVV